MVVGCWLLVVGMMHEGAVDLRGLLTGLVVCREQWLIVCLEFLPFCWLF